MDDISFSELQRVRRECLCIGVHEATDMYRPFTSKWRIAVDRIALEEFNKITGRR